MGTKLKFKVGDKVRVKSLEWYNNQPKDMYGDIHEGITFIKDMVRYCGKVLSIIKLYEDSYGVDVTSYVWQDWMLEDDAVTEEKQEVEQLNKIQEVEQLNKINMETKKMTLQEAQELVKNTKYLVFTEDESMFLQKKLIEIGCEWRDSGKIVCNTEYPFLYVNKDLIMTCDRKLCYNSFETKSNQYKQNHDIINIEIEYEQPKPKFDPNTLKPFDKVLVRQNEKGVWLARLYECKDDVEFHVTNGGSWTFCIPYNDDTKHLHRTKDEAPEFYKLD